MFSCQSVRSDLTCFNTLFATIFLKIDLSQRGLMPMDARLVKMAILQNQRLTVLKLGYNNLGDEGASILADGGIGKNRGTGGGAYYHLESLDLGFNNIGDTGCSALCRGAVSERLQTLYLAGNAIGGDGAIAVADLIRRTSCRLQKLYLTGNILGPEGVKAISEAVLCAEQRNETEETSGNNHDPDDDMHLSNKQQETDQNNQSFLEELYLGGTGMGLLGCESIALLLQNTCRICVLSLPNCEIHDESLYILADAIKTNRDRLPLKSLQLSFNQITCKGVERLVNAFCGSQTLKELLIDNNEVADRGAQHIASILLPEAKTLETLNVGFNQIKSAGIKVLMKSVVESGSSLQSLSISGNSVDTSAAKAISYLLAYNRTLTTLSLVHCIIGHEGQRHITAGIVSNSQTVLRELFGFDIGPVVVTLGFPVPLESWNNCQLLCFVRTMWERHHEGISLLSNGGGGNDSISDEHLTDPLHCLGPARSVPEDATIVVEVAKKAFAELATNVGDFDNCQWSGTGEAVVGCPLVADDIMLESSSNYPVHCRTGSNDTQVKVDGQSNPSMLTNNVASFIAKPEAPTPIVYDPAQRKVLSEWLSANIKDAQKLAQQPFNVGELWRLHQHYFTPVVNESGGESITSPTVSTMEHATSNVPFVFISSSFNNPSGLMNEHGISALATGSLPTINGPRNQLASLPILKRKVSYKFLSDAAVFASAVGFPQRNVTEFLTPAPPLPVMIEAAPLVQSMPPKTKRARRNRSRISFLPRTKAKLDSYLDVCHEKALITMRQLYFVECALLEGKVHPLDPDDAMRSSKYLCGVLAHEAEILVVDMI